MASRVEEIVSLAVDSKTTYLQELGHKIWSNPELYFNEHFACSSLTRFLESEGFSISKEVGGLQTAFIASFGTGHPHVTFLCEYDALPEIGHACGHNLIAEAGVTAGVGVKAVLEQCPSLSGRVSVFGTPAEENGGGKVIMLSQGCFSDVDVAIMIHPSPYNDLMPLIVSCEEIEVTFSGKEAHACAFPWQGKNSLDAAVMAYTSISLLRQQIKSNCRIQCIIVQGGIETYIIPSRSVMRVCVRAPTEEETAKLFQKVKSCIESAAHASGCAVDIKLSDFRYKSLRSNTVLAELFSKQCEKLAIDFSDSSEPSKLLISSDIGDVSQVVPTIHPLYSIGTALNHTAQFTEVADTPEAHRITQSMGKAMALTAIEILKNSEMLENIKREFLSLS